MIVVEFDLLEIIALLTLVTAVPVFQGWRNWYGHKLRRQAAEANGWRYTRPGLRTYFSSAYSMAGTSPSGFVWHFRRLQRERQWFYEWSSQNNLLPFGAFIIQPRSATTLPWKERFPHLRPVTVGSHSWREAYKVLVTHDILSERFFSHEVELALSHWPGWPKQGALEKIVWEPDALSICVRYKIDWPTIDRVIILGTALVENVDRE